MTLPEVTLGLFTFFNSFRVFSYLPQIARIMADRTGAASIALSTWVIWIGANSTTTAYAIVNLGDWKLAVFNGANTLCCCVVLLLTLLKRRARAELQPAH